MTNTLVRVRSRTVQVYQIGDQEFTEEEALNLLHRLLDTMPPMTRAAFMTERTQRIQRGVEMELERQRADREHREMRMNSPA